MILVIHHPAEQDAPSTIRCVLDISRQQVYQQIKSKVSDFDFDSAWEIETIISKAEKAGQLKRLEFSAVLSDVYA